MVLVAILFFLCDPVCGHQITLTPGVTVSAEYTDNLEQDSEERREDLITVISPNLSASITGKTAEASLFYSPSFSLYKNANQNNTFRHSGRFLGSGDISKNTRFALENAYIRTEEPNSPELETQGDIETTTRGREIYHNNNASLNLIHALNAYCTVTLGYGNRIYRNEDPEVDNIENHEPSVGLTLWIIPGQMSVEADASFTRAEYGGGAGSAEYDNDYNSWDANISLLKRFSRQLDAVLRYSRSAMRFASPGGDYKIYEVATGLDYLHDVDTSLSFGIGYYVRDNEDTDYESGLSLNASVNQSFKYWSVNFDGAGGYEESYFADEILGFAKYYQMGGSVRFSLSRNLTGDIFGSFRNDKWEDTAPQRLDDTFRAGANISYQPLRWFSVNGAYIYRKVDSSLPENSFWENRFVVSVSATTVRPIRLWY